jgi:hypothetical protein
MNPFEKHGITHLSPSSLNLYAANPCLWVGRYLAKWQDDMGPAGHRGSAIESGFDLWLYDRTQAAEAAKVAHCRFTELTQGVADDDHEAERANIAPMLSQAILALANAPVPVARQIKVEYWANGLEIPIIGYVDYLWEDHGVDLKTTKACPSAIKSDHGRQIALYAEAKGRPFKILYVTGKKFALYTMSPEEQAANLRDLERLARAVRHLLKKAEDAEDAARFFAPEFSDFRWGAKTIDAANTAYGSAA